MSPLPLAPRNGSQPWRRQDGSVSNDVGEREFMERVGVSDGFWRSLGSLSKKTGLEVDELESFGRDICRSVWSEADAVMTSDGPVAAARGEIAGLKQKLTKCNLSTMKQMLAAKSGAVYEGDLGDDTICFHEPMQYLDEDTKELVMSIVCDKMRQLENNTAPPSLVQALVQHAQAQADPKESASMAELLETKAQLEDARADLRKARARAEEAEEISRKFEVNLRAAEDRAKKFEEELVQTKTLLAATQEKLAASEKALAELRAEHAALQASHAKLQELSVQQQATIERQVRELDYERRANERLKAEVERLQEFVKKAERLEKELKALQVRFNELEAEANSMREELARRNNTRTAGTQTSLTGKKLDEKAAETRKLKLMLEELQTKLKELMTEYRRKFGDAAKKIAEDLGLTELLKEETVFQRLYDDAIERVHRLEKLRERVKKEKQGTPGMTPGSPRSNALCSPEISIMESIDKAQPSAAMRKLVQDFKSPSQEEGPPPVASWAARAQRQDSGCGDNNIGDGSDVWQRLQKASPPGYPIMKSSTSLPTLPKAEQHVAMLTLNLAGAGGGSRKNTKRREFF